jgi:hypothetical protein
VAALARDTSELFVIVRCVSFHFVTSSGFVISCFAETDEGNQHGEHIEHLANNTADGGIVYVVNYPKRRDAEKLSYADSLAVARPHSERAAALRYKEERGNPPFFAEENGRGNAGGGEAKLHKPEVEGFFAFVSERENNSAHYAENIEEHTRPRGEEKKLHCKGNRATHLEKKIALVFLALI